MKKTITLSLLVLLGLSLSFGQAMFDDFESNRRGTYSFVHGNFIPYTGNPDMTGNTSPVVAKYTRNAAEQFDVLVIEADANFEDLNTYLSGTKQMSIDVWSPLAGITVQITLEDASLSEGAPFPTGRHSVYLTTTTQTMAWETLTFTFDTRPDASVSNVLVDRLVLLFNPNSNTNDTYYYDNLVGPALSPDVCDGVMMSDSILNDFECNQSAYVTFTHGQSLRRIPNPDMTVNTSPFVATYIRNAGEENDVIVGGFPTPLALGDTNAVRLMVWDAGAPTEVVFSLQFNNGDSTVEIAAASAMTSKASQWEEIEFRYGDLSAATINEFVLLFDPGAFAASTYFFDNMSYVAGNDLVGIEDLLVGSVLQVAPNPSQGISRFSYELTNAADVSLSIYDLAGREVAQVVNGFQAAGKQEVSWKAGSLANGLYVYQMTVNGFPTSGKIVLTQ